MNATGGTRFATYGPTILRVVVGAVFIAHGLQKLLTMGLDGTAGFFGQIGIPLPALAAAVVTAVEILGGAALVLGLFTPWAAVPLVIDMLTALFVFHLPNGFFVSDGGVEFVLTLGAASAALALMGPGALSLDGMLAARRAAPGAAREDVPAA